MDLAAHLAWQLPSLFGPGELTKGATPLGSEEVEGDSWQDDYTVTRSCQDGSSETTCHYTAKLWLIGTAAPPSVANVACIGDTNTEALNRCSSSTPRQIRNLSKRTPRS